MPSAGYTGCESGGYARKHNGWVVLILTMDEDDDTPANHIFTVIVGQKVKPGTSARSSA